MNTFTFIYYTDSLTNSCPRRGMMSDFPVLQFYSVFLYKCHILGAFFPINFKVSKGERSTLWIPEVKELVQQMAVLSSRSGLEVERPRCI